MAQKSSGTDSGFEALASEAVAPTVGHRITGFLLAMVAGFGLLLCVACIGSIYIFRPEVNESPEEVARVQAEMLTLDIPEGFEPRGTIDWNVLFVFSMQGVYYEHTLSNSLLALIEIEGRFVHDDNVRAHIDDAFRQQRSGQKSLTVQTRETKMITIRNQPVPFEFAVGKDEADNVYHVVEGVVAGRSGPVLVMMQVESDIWNEQAAVRMLESIE